MHSPSKVQVQWAIATAWSHWRSCKRICACMFSGHRWDAHCFFMVPCTSICQKHKPWSESSGFPGSASCPRANAPRGGDAEPPCCSRQIASISVSAADGSERPSESAAASPTAARPAAGGQRQHQHPPPHPLQPSAIQPGQNSQPGAPPPWIGAPPSSPSAAVEARVGCQWEQRLRPKGAHARAIAPLGGGGGEAGPCVGWAG